MEGLSVHKAAFAVFSLVKRQSNQHTAPPHTIEKDAASRLEHACCDRNIFNVLL